MKQPNRPRLWRRRLIVAGAIGTLAIVAASKTIPLSGGDLLVVTAVVALMLVTVKGLERQVSRSRRKTIAVRARSAPSPTPRLAGRARPSLSMAPSTSETESPGAPRVVRVQRAAGSGASTRGADPGATGRDMQSADAQDRSERYLTKDRVRISPVVAMRANKPPHTREERIARNEDWCRSLNQRHAQVIGGLDPMAGFRCECWREDCTARIPLRREEWTMVRAQPNRFAVAPGHVAEKFEAVIKELPDFWMVEKFGEAGELAEQLAERGTAA